MSYEDPRFYEYNDEPDYEPPEDKVTLTDNDTLDHLCRVTRCCNPAHLEIVGRGENSKRRHLYGQLKSENIRYRRFIKSLGHDPDKVLEQSSANIYAPRRLRRKRASSR